MGWFYKGPKKGQKSGQKVVKKGQNRKKPEKSGKSGQKWKKVPKSGPGPPPLKKKARCRACGDPPSGLWPRDPPWPEIHHYCLTVFSVLARVEVFGENPSKKWKKRQKVVKKWKKGPKTPLDPPTPKKKARCRACGDPPSGLWPRDPPWPEIHHYCLTVFSVLARVEVFGENPSKKWKKRQKVVKKWKKPPKTGLGPPPEKKSSL